MGIELADKLKMKKALPLKHEMGWLFIVMLMALLPLSSFSQAGKRHIHRGSNLMVEAKAGYGFLIPHRLEMEIFNSHFTSFELSISKKTYGANRWEFMYGYPIVGLAYWYSYLGTSPYLGDAHAVFPYINFPITPNRSVRPSTNTR